MDINKYVALYAICIILHYLQPASTVTIVVMPQTKASLYFTFAAECAVIEGILSKPDKWQPVLISFHKRGPGAAASELKASWAL